MATVFCWFHQDLRLGDNPALWEAVSSGSEVIPIYILDDEAAGVRAPGGASRWWLHHSLASLSKDLERLGSRLILARGKAEDIFPKLVAEMEASGIYTHRRNEPWAQAQLERVSTALKGKAKLHLCDSVLLKPSGSVLSKSGGRFRVFTPFMNAMLKQGSFRSVIEKPSSIPAPKTWLHSLTLEELDLLPKKPNWGEKLTPFWQIGEQAAHQNLERFITEAIEHYANERDLPSASSVSRLSPHLHFGEISPITIYHRVMGAQGGSLSGGAEKFIAEVIWREFCYELLDQFPDMPTRPLRREFECFPWRDNFASDLSAWQRGQTGYPLVDAGMRELYESGWMHNRLRMITASFLTKHLLIPWQEGERWFFDKLVDADLASNTANWQWVAGCGADAAPYFRIFNPITQGEKFSAADYVRRWVPEVADRPDATLFTPKSGEANYPSPLIDHPTARERALEAFASIKAKKA